MTATAQGLNGKNGMDILDEQYDWRSVALPSELDKQSLESLLLVCGVMLKLRLPIGSTEEMVIEVYCRSGEEFATAESILHQAAADWLLRKKIRDKSDLRIRELVDNVLMRASKG